MMFLARMQKVHSGKRGFGNPNFPLIKHTVFTRKKFLVTLIKRQSHPPKGICWDIELEDTKEEKKH